MSEEDFADWFADSERKRYEDWLSQKIRFSVRVRNWIYEFKWRYMKNWIKELIRSYKWRRGSCHCKRDPGS